MSDKSHEWFLLVKGTPGERHDLTTPGRYPLMLEAVLDAVDPRQSLDWSGNFYGNPAIVEYIIETQRYDVPPEDVLPVTGGTSMANFLTCMALLKPGDEVICETPAWTQVGSICRRMGVKVNWWCLRPEDDWKPDLDRLKTLINTRTKLIYLCNPNNPTGSVLSEDEMVELCKLASQHGTYVLCDEIYRGLEWRSEELSPSVVNCYERGISTSSLTKTLGACGIRFGWFVTRDKGLYDECFDIYYDCALCNNILSERIALKLLEPAKYHDLLEEGKAVGRENLSLLVDMVARSDLWSMSMPEGAYCCLVKKNTPEPSWDFCKRLLESKPIGVALVPGITYNDYCEDYVRIGFGVVKPDTFRSALAIVEAEAKNYKR
ncbi:MAG: pyridoxal phosphate-dependent aminotransferase [Dehalococcoidia bacterium]